MSLQDLARVITMSERLVQASHPAAEVITSRAGDMRSERDKLVGVVEARVAIVSVLFHDINSLHSTVMADPHGSTVCTVAVTAHCCPHTMLP